MSLEAAAAEKNGALQVGGSVQTVGDKSVRSTPRPGPLPKSEIWSTW